jgi:hypothetical protein
MKEATGELNMTVITVVAIAAIAALFTIFIMPSIQANIMLQTACSNIDADGNYNGVDGDSADTAKQVECNAFSCTATYNGRNYTKRCSGTGDGGATGGGGEGGHVVINAAE